MVSLSFIPLILAMCQHASKYISINEIRPCEACKKQTLVNGESTRGNNGGVRAPTFPKNGS